MISKEGPWISKSCFAQCPSPIGASRPSKHSFRPGVLDARRIDGCSNSSLDNPSEDLAFSPVCVYWTRTDYRTRGLKFFCTRVRWKGRVHPSSTQSIATLTHLFQGVVWFFFLRRIGLLHHPLTTRPASAGDRRGWLMADGDDD